jgi:hypothetical protein
MVHLAMALALFWVEDYEEVAARLVETLPSWGYPWRPSPGVATLVRTISGQPDVASVPA